MTLLLVSLGVCLITMGVVLELNGFMLAAIPFTGVGTGILCAAYLQRRSI